MATIRVNINPEILSWAVTRMGIDIKEYSCEDQKFAKWINGESCPTFVQAQDFAKKFVVPFGFLFLDTPPKESIPIPYFRRRNGGEQGVYISQTILTLQDRQEWLSDYLRNKGIEKRNYVGFFKNSNDPSEIVAYMRTLLGLQEDWAFALASESQAIKKIVEQAENIGVNICFNSSLGNNTKRTIHVDDCRGFCLVDDYAPFVFVNSNDADAAKVFTLIHEFAHILKGYSAGIGDYGNLDNASEIEKFCNKVASDFLVPKRLFKEIWDNHPYQYSKIAKKFKVSKMVIAIKAKENRLISQQRLKELLDAWRSEPVNSYKKNNGHPDMHRIMLRRVGRFFLVNLNNALHENRLLYTEAYRLAGMKGDTFHTITDAKMATL